MFLARPMLALGLTGLAAVCGWAGGDANAQQIFRIVGPDGRVTFSDKPPMAPGAKASTAPVVQMPGGTGNASLPFELRQVSSRYPVTLYTAPGCTPCASGRAMLSGRGIPFSERTVTSSEDIEALKRLAGAAATLPFLTIGAQQLKGYSESEWVQFIDAAGYPKTSQLPSGYRPSPASPLVAAQDPQRDPAPTADTRATQDLQPERAASPGPSADNPTGIRF